MSEELEAKLKAVSDKVDKLIAFIESAPPEAKGLVSPDGGTADHKTTASRPGQATKTTTIHSLGDFCVAIHRRDTKRLEDVYGSTKTLQEGAGASGGYTVPPEFTTNMMDLSVEQELIWPLAAKQPMARAEFRIPALDIAGTTYQAGSSTALAGLTLRWYGEGATIGESEPKFRQMLLKPHKAGTSVPVSNELLADNAIGLEALLSRMFGDAVKFTRDWQFFRGDGVGKPLGIYNSPCLVTTTDAFTATPTVLELATMYQRLPASSDGRALWAIHSLLFAALMDVGSTSTAANALSWLPDINGRPGPALFGLPVRRSEKLPSSFATGGMALIDPKYYIAGDRAEIEIAMSEHVNFDDDETKWRVTTRVEGQPLWNGPMVIGSGANDSVSPFIRSV